MSTKLGKSKLRIATAGSATGISSSVVLRQLGHSFIITLPREIVAKMRLEKGNRLNLETDPDGDVLTISWEGK